MSAGRPGLQPQLSLTCHGTPATQLPLTSACPLDLDSDNIYCGFSSWWHEAKNCTYIISLNPQHDPVPGARDTDRNMGGTVLAIL